MSLGVTTLAEIRGMVRAKVQRYSAEVFDDTEIDRVINSKTHEVFLGMNEETQRKYYTRKEQSLHTGWGDLLAMGDWLYSKPVPSDYFSAISLQQCTPEGRFLYYEEANLEDSALRMRSEVGHEYFIVMLGPHSVGDPTNLILRVYATMVFGGTYGPLYFFYVGKPVSMVDGAATVDLPDEYLGILVLLAAADLLLGVKIESEQADTIMQMFALSIRETWAGIGLTPKVQEGV